MSARHFRCEAAGSSNVPFYPYKEIEKATNRFSEKQRLGTRAYVMNEIKLLSSMSDPDLVRLLGCCIENGEQILVCEFMPHGTLSQHLQRERGTGLPWTVHLTIASETAHAIACFHSAMNPPIYHRDIKSSNILLVPNFGVILVEIITALKAVDFSRPHTKLNLAALAIDRIGKGHVDEIIDPFLEPHRDAWTLSSVHKVAELAFRRLMFHRDVRPSMMEVADELEQIRPNGCALMEENTCTTSSVASSCLSPYNGSGSHLVACRLRRLGDWLQMYVKESNPSSGCMGLSLGLGFAGAPSVILFANGFKERKSVKMDIQFLGADVLICRRSGYPHRRL
ncbi:hypothetical protein ACSBR1_008372 [Camellia fascicularis]